LHLYVCATTNDDKADGLPHQVYISRVEYISFNLAITGWWIVNLSTAKTTFQAFFK